MKRAISLLAVLALVFSMGAVSAYAETGEPTGPDAGGESTPVEPEAPPEETPVEPEIEQNDMGAASDYGYTVRVLAGAKGVFADDESTLKEYPNNRYGAKAAEFNAESFKVSDERYYVQGLRRSGRDRNEEGEADSLTWEVLATGDVDYVVSYGLRGNLVRYTVRYEDANGQTLHAEDTFYGNVGEQPVVTYRYIDGYMPQAYNMRKTLVEDETQNVLTFVYRPAGGVQIVEETVTDYGTTVVEIPGGATGVGGVVGGGGGGAGAGAGGGGAAAAGPGGDAAVVGPDAGPGGDGGAVNIAPEDTPQGILDLDEDQSALGNLKLDEETTNRFSLFGAVVGAMAGVAGLGWLLWFLLVGRKRRRDEDEA